MRLGAYPARLRAGSRAAQAYGTTEISERHRHRWEVNNSYRDVLAEHGLRLSGQSPDGGLVEVIELPDHPWFIGCQFHPELKSRPNRPHPFFTAFIAAAVRQRYPAGTTPVADGTGRHPVSSWSFRRTPFLIAGPCVVEDGDTMARVSEAVAEAGARFDMPVCFKASFDKANRARAGGARGPGLDAGLEALARVKRETGLPILTDIHEPDQAAPSAEVADVLQIPAFLCRQTDLLLAAGATGQAGERQEGAVDAGRRDGRRGGEGARGRRERGGGHRARHLLRLRRPRRGFPQLRPASRGDRRAGDLRRDALGAAAGAGRAAARAAGLRQHIPDLMAAAAVAGADGFFLETHPDPARALSDAATQWPLDRLSWLLERTLDLWHRARESAHVAR